MLTTWTDQLAQTEWLYYRSRYGELDVGDGRGAPDPRRAARHRRARRAGRSSRWCPAPSGWFTRMGAATLVVYLFHGFVVKGAEYAGFLGWAASTPRSRCS